MTFDQPAYTVQLDVADPTATPTWRDITNKVLAWTVDGPKRRRLIDRYSAGRASFTLDNSSGDFTPTNTAGAYYPNLKPTRRIRVGWGAAGAPEEWEFTGLVDGWPRRYDVPNADQVTITATDATTWLARVELRSAYEVEVRADNPRAWYRLGESSGTQATDSSGNGRHGTYEGGATFNSRAGLIAEDPDNAIEFNSLERKVKVPPAGALQGATWTLEGWMQMPSALTVQATLWIQEKAGNSYDGRVVLLVATDGSLVAKVGNPEAIARDDTDYRDDDEHHVAVTWDGTILRLYVDGAQRVTANPTGVATSAPVETHIGNYTGTGPEFFPRPPYESVNTSTEGLFTLDEMAIYNTALSATRIAAHHAAGSAPHSGDLPGTRLGRILDAVKWPVGDRDLDVGRSKMSAANWAGKKALDAALACADAEGIGALYADGSGRIVLVDRDTMWTETRRTTSQATFGAGAGEVPYVGPLNVDHDDDQVATRAIASRTRGAEVVVDVAAAQSTHGIIDISKTGLEVTDDATVRGLAEFMADEYSAPSDTASALTLAPGTDEAVWTQARTRQLGDRITVRPPDGSAAIVATVEGKSWSVDGRRVRCVLTLGRALKPVWRWDVSTWDQTTRWGF